MSSGSLSPPQLPEEISRGSSVSSGLQQEYEELLRYAVVTPRIDVPENIYHKTALNGFTVKINAAAKLADSATDSDHSKESSSAQSGLVYEPSQLARDAVRHLPEFTDKDHSLELDQLQMPSQSKIQQDVTEAHMAKGATVPKDIDSTPESVSSHKSLLSDTPQVTDTDIMRVETLMDEWCLDLKRNVLAEFSMTKMRLLERYKDQLCKERERHSVEVFNLQSEIESLKEVLHSYEKSITQKDLVIGNMTGAIQKQRERYEQLKTFAAWRMKHNDDKREIFAGKLAAKHYERALASKVLAGWRGLVESKWKQRVEKACQARAQEVCIKLTEDYEERLQGLQKNLDDARTEVAAMHHEREQYQETMKKAFMRGVCALNMEAMTMFREGKVEPEDGTLVRGQSQTIRAPPPQSFTQPVENVTTMPTRPPVETQAGHQSIITQGRKGPGGKTLHLTATARTDIGSRKGAGSSFPSTISSVLVERHTSSNENIPSSTRPETKVIQGKAKTVRFDKSAGIPSSNGKPTGIIRPPNVKVVQ